MKRFTDTEKYSDPWFRKLPVLYKQFWDYLCARCDNAGVWKPDFELASFCIGETLDETKIKEAFGDRIFILEDGKWWIRKFVPFQFGALSPLSRVHQSVFELLKGHGIWYDKGIYTVSKGLKTGKGKGQDKEEGGVGGDSEPPFDESNIPTLQEVSTYGASLNISDEVCKSFFDHHESHNIWVNQHGKLINWRHKLPVWNQNQRHYVAGRNGVPVERVPLWKAIQLLEEEISKHVANKESAFCTKRPTELEIADLKSKRAKLNELKHRATANA